MQMRDGPNRMARNPEKEIMNLSQLVRGDLRIRTPLDRSPSKISHDVIKRRRLIVRINRMLAKGTSRVEAITEGVIV